MTRAALGLEFRLNRTGWDDVNGCWIWRGAKNDAGYGMIPNDPGLGRNSLLVHRVAYEFWVGIIPDGDLVMHSCDNPPCINPNHLLAGTHKQNMDDMARKSRTHGRKLTPEQAEQIYLRRAEGSATLERDYEISRAVIHSIWKRKTWKWVTEKFYKEDS